MSSGRGWTALIVASLALGAAAPVVAEEGEQTERRAEIQWRESWEKHDRSDDIRQKSHDAGKGRSAQAAKLDREGDQQEKKAASIEPIEWPPSGTSGSSETSGSSRGSSRSTGSHRSRKPAAE
ncbi:MAG: hypothetical protein QOD06_2303 [Candidatus Binatota bacterium]|jgi:hypothetical protein|nr:hypothetical protein [Candidatus Binatota bacterium]